MATNDPKNQKIRLQLGGLVEKLAKVTPPRVVLRGAVGETITRTVTIVPETRKPFKIDSVRALKGTDIRHELKKRGDPGKGYELTVTNTREQPGRYYDRLVLQTDISERTTISIVVIGTIREQETQGDRQGPQ